MMKIRQYRDSGGRELSGVLALPVDSAKYHEYNDIATAGETIAADADNSRLFSCVAFKSHVKLLVGSNTVGQRVGNLHEPYMFVLPKGQSLKVAKGTTSAASALLVEYGTIDL